MVVLWRRPGWPTEPDTPGLCCCNALRLPLTNVGVLILRHKRQHLQDNTLLDATFHLVKHYDHPKMNTIMFSDFLIKWYIFSPKKISDLDNNDTSMFLAKMIDMRKRFSEFQSANESMYFPSTNKWQQNLDHAIEASKLHLKVLLSQK